MSVGTGRQKHYNSVLEITVSFLRIHKREQDIYIYDFHSVETARFFLIFISALQRQNAKNLKQIFPEKEYRGLSPNFHIQVSVSELYISTLGLPFLLEEICGMYKSLTDT